jgi:sugar phosphate isomerase/epimerase
MDVRQGFMVEHGADPEAAFAFAADRGFDFVELNMDYQFERTRVDAGRVRDLAAEHGLDLVAHLPYRLDEGSTHEHVRDGVVRELRAAVDAAAEMGCETGVMHAASMGHPGKYDGADLRPYV